MHDHHHNDHSHAPKLQEGNRKVFLAAIALNLLFVVVEVIAGLIYNSMALLTDAGHNLSDVGSLLISLLAFWAAKRKSTAVYTYGYKKTTVLAALVNAVILLIAIGVLGFESVTRLLHPQKVDGNMIAWVAAIGIVINSITAWLFYRGKGKELNTKAAYLHMLSDALVSVGVVAAGIVLAYTGWYWLDPTIGIVIMIVILIGTWDLLSESFKMTIDAVPEGIELQHVKDLILKVPSVKSVDHVHVWPLSTTENALTAHVVIETSLSFEQKIKVVEEIKHELLHHNIHHCTIELAT
jgi:cobalt-zinc-cadmium efflux system protein